MRSLCAAGALVAAALVSGDGLTATLDAARPLGDRVVIRRDTFGIPHILAETDEAAAYALGYAQAEDHPEALARWLLAARGEAARYFGPDLVDDDIGAHRLRNAEEARAALRVLDPTFRRMVEAFAQGANRFMSTHRGEVPAWMPVFTAADVLAGTRDDAVGAVNARSLVRALAAKYPSAPAPPAAVDDNGPESNALALAGSRTASGHAILLGNPHLAWRTRYWEAHVTVPGRLDFFGSTLVGYPWLRAGFNQHLGYVQTNNAPDLEDVFALDLDPQRPGHYVFEGRSRALVRREIALEVKQADGSLRTEPHVFWDSHLGPIVHRTAERAFAVASSRRDAWRYFEGFWRLSRARHLAEFLRVMRMGLIPQSNFTYADEKGNVLYLWNARLPRRVEDGTSYELDVPASTAKYVWRRMHPVAELPQLLNPRGGYVQNANNSPWYTSARDAIDPARYPGYVERRELGLRPQIALEMLEARRTFSPDDVRALKYSTRMLLADRVKTSVLAAIAAVPDPTEALRSAREVLDAWDNQVAATSRGAVLFQRFWDQYSAEVTQPFAVPWDRARPFDTPRGLRDPVRALKHLEDAVAWARETYGSEAVAWGEVHRFRFGDLDLPGDGAPGSYGLYRVLSFANAEDGKRVAGLPAGAPDLLGSGDAWVLLVHFTRPVQAQSILAYGQSTRAGSPHGRDQIRLFASHQLRPVWFRESEVEAHSERSYRP
jgi:acyl-homoserine-lactone acylase